MGQCDENILWIQYLLNRSTFLNQTWYVGASPAAREICQIFNWLDQENSNGSYKNHDLLCCSFWTADLMVYFHSLYCERKMDCCLQDVTMQVQKFNDRLFGQYCPKFKIFCNHTWNGDALQNATMSCRGFIIFIQGQGHSGGPYIKL